jgi:molybdate transport system permease protein
LLEAVVDLPIVLPPSVAGLAFRLVFGRSGLLSAPFEVLGISVPFTTVAVVLAQVFVSAPFFVRSAWTGIAGVDRISRMPLASTARPSASCSGRLRCRWRARP